MSTEANITGIQLENIDPDTKQAPETRIKHAGIGRQIFLNMEYDDRKRNLLRARHQAMLDGEPPYDQAVRAAKGQGTLTNVNWGDAKNIVDNFMSGIIDMNAGVENLVNIPIDRVYVPDDAQRKNYENIVSQEVTRAIRMWEGYDQAYLNLGHWFGAHGVGIAYFEDAFDWRFETTGLGDFVIPTGTKASENAIVIGGCRRYIELHQLYSYIRKEKAAQQMGWNVEMVKAAMLTACPETIWEGSPVSWQRLEAMIRNNDLGTGYGAGVSPSAGNNARTAKVGVLHLWWQEFDGKVTKAITTINQVPDYKDKEEPWLFMKESVYPEMRRGLMFFPYGIGDNGTYHSISGILRAIYPQVNAINRSQSQMLDAAIMGASVMMQPTTEASISRMNIVPMGPVWLMPSADHAEMVPRQNPDVARSVMPVIADLRQTINQRAGQFQGSDSPFASPKEKTRFEVAAQLESLSKVGATQAKLWYSPWSRLMREVSRRLCRANYSEAQPGGKEAAEFRKRLELRGFPLPLLEAIDFDGITANQAVGGGSGAARIGRLTNLRELAPEMDDIGRYNLNRDLTAAELGGDYDAADRYMPERPGSRPPIDAQFADLENNVMKLGQEPVIEVNQLDAVHLDRHLPFLGSMIQSVESGEAAMDDVIEPMVICYYHAADHLERIQDSLIMQEKVAQYRQMIQQLGEFVINAQRKVIAERMKAAEQAQAEGAQGQQMDPGLQEKAIAARIKLEAMTTEAETRLAYDQRKHEQDLAQKSEAFRQQMAHKDAATAADLIVKAKEKMTKAELAKKQKEDAMEIAKLKRGKPNKTDK